MFNHIVLDGTHHIVEEVVIALPHVFDAFLHKILDVLACYWGQNRVDVAPSRHVASKHASRHREDSVCVCVCFGFHVNQ